MHSWGVAHSWGVSTTKHAASQSGVLFALRMSANVCCKGRALSAVVRKMPLVVARLFVGSCTDKKPAAGCAVSVAVQSPYSLLQALAHVLK
jgi:hypothetical protein